jgi:tetrahydromethanopterin S-methyltransferase subunit G
MGFIEEGRQLIQDFVTPEIRSIDARLTAMEKKLEALEGKVGKFGTKLEGIQSTLEAKIERNHLQVMDTLHRMENYSQILERLARLESKMQNVA